MHDRTASHELIDMTISITASPVVQFATIRTIQENRPHEVAQDNQGGFAIYLDVSLRYDKLSDILNGLLAGMRIALSEGLFAQHVVINRIILGGTKEGQVVMQADFTGSFSGTVFLRGNPVYNADSKMLDMKDLQYDLQTKSLLLKGAKWLFAGKIAAALNRAARIDLTSYLEAAQKAVDGFLNREWANGIMGIGSVGDLNIVSAEALPQHLQVRAACLGHIQISVSGLKLNFQH